jgi:hypothetical protein
MRENVGSIDQAVRSVLGPAMIVLGYAKLGGRQGKTAGLLTMMAGVSLVESAITRVCPLTALFGLDTRSPHEKIRDRNAALGLGRTESVSEDAALEVAEELSHHEA